MSDDNRWRLDLDEPAAAVEVAPEPFRALEIEDTPPDPPAAADPPAGPPAVEAAPAPAAPAAPAVDRFASIRAIRAEAEAAGWARPTEEEVRRLEAAPPVQRPAAVASDPPRGPAVRARVPGAEELRRSIVFMAERSELSAAVAYWRIASPIPTEALEAAWLESGLPERLAPNLVSVDTALTRAVEAAAKVAHLPKGVKRYKRKLTDGTGRQVGWFIKEETQRAGLDPLTRNLISAKLADGRPVVECMDSTYEEHAKLAEAVHAEFTALRGMLTPSDVKRWLSQTVIPELHGVSLIETGGLYFIPRDQIALLDRVVRVVEGLDLGSIYLNPAMPGSAHLEAAIDSLAVEVDKVAADAAAAIQAVGDGEPMHPRTARAQSAALEAATAKVARYESLVGVDLSASRKRLSDLNRQVGELAARHGSARFAFIELDEERP